MYRNEQEKEIATIAPRTFKLELSDADVKRIFEKAGSVGLTPEELIEDFIGDLVDGTYTNGSDERYLAQDWYERCWFSFYGYGSFLAYLIREDEYRNFIRLKNDIAEYEDEIEYTVDDEKLSSEEKEEEIEYFRSLIADVEAELRELFDDYCEYNPNHEDYESEAEKVLEYHAKMKAVLSERKK